MIIRWLGWRRGVLIRGILGRVVMLNRRGIIGLRVSALRHRRALHLGRQVSIMIRVRRSVRCAPVGYGILRLLLVRIWLPWRRLVERGIVVGEKFMLELGPPCSAKDGLVGSMSFVRRLLTRPAGLVQHGARWRGLRERRGGRVVVVSNAWET